MGGNECDGIARAILSGGEAGALGHDGGTGRDRLAAVDDVMLLTNTRLQKLPKPMPLRVDLLACLHSGE